MIKSFLPLLTHSPIIGFCWASLVAFIITFTTRGQGNLMNWVLEMMQKSTDLLKNNKEHLFRAHCELIA